MTAARYLNANHSLVEFIRADGAVLQGPVPPNDGPTRTEYMAWINAGHSPTPFQAPLEQVGMPPQIIAAVLKVVPADGDIAEFSGAFGLVAAVYLSVGQYLLLFAEPQFDTNYFVYPMGGIHLDVIDCQTDYVTIELHDTAGGTAIDPPSFGVQIYRA